MKILLIKLDAIGDAVLFTSVIESITNLFPNIQLDIMCNRQCKDIYRLNKKISTIFHNIADIKDKYDILINGHFSRTRVTDLICEKLFADEKYAFFGDNCNISEKERLEGNLFYTNLINTNEKLELNKYKDLLNEIFKKVCYLEEYRKPKLYFPNRFKEFNLPEDYSVLVPFSAYFYKDYPVEKFYNALKDYKYNILVLGTGDQYGKASYFAFKDKKFRVLCGKTTLLEVMEIIKNAKRVFGVDTGLLHIAAALDIPNIAIVGQGHYERFLPWSNSTTIVTGKDKDGNICPYANCNWRCRYANFQCVKLADLEGVL